MTGVAGSRFIFSLGLINDRLLRLSGVGVAKGEEAPQPKLRGLSGVVGKHPPLRQHTRNDLYFLRMVAVRVTRTLRGGWKNNDSLNDA